MQCMCEENKILYFDIIHMCPMTNVSIINFTNYNIILQIINFNKKFTIKLVNQFFLRNVEAPTNLK